jgi:hypothetical protein
VVKPELEIGRERRYFAAERQAAVDDHAALALIDRGALGVEDRVSYDVFKFQRTDDLKGFDPALLTALIDRPIEHFSGTQTFVLEGSLSFT